MYTLIFGWGATAALPLAFVIIVGCALILSQFTKNHWITVHTQVFCIIYITTGIQWSIGGLADSGFVIAWALCGPLVALFFYPVNIAIGWFAAYLITMLVTIIHCTSLSEIQVVEIEIRRIFLIMNVAASSVVVFLFSIYFLTKATAARKRVRELLLNVLPEEIVPRLENHESPIADGFNSASVMFVDMVGSTPLFAEMSANDVVEWINEVFTNFDRCVQKHGGEKIRTIGDNYMVAFGVPRPRADHAQACTALALDMLQSLSRIKPRNGKRMSFRLGIHSGPLIAGVIGEHKFQYDLWGDTVNLASRMESTGVVGRVQVSHQTKILIENAFLCESRGHIPIKGKGKMETWLVAAPKSAP